MKWSKQYLVALGLAASAAWGQRNDPLLDAAREAWQRRQTPKLQALADQALGQQHPLAAWVDYWRHQVRLSESRAEDFATFAQRWPGSYVEDRLRNDWLLVLGQRQDWTAFAAEYPRFRMDDDREVHCHALAAEQALQRPLKGDDARPFKERALIAWLAQREPDQACTALARHLLETGTFGHPELWRKLMRSAEEGRARAFKQAASLNVGKGSAPGGAAFIQAWDDPGRTLSRAARAKGRWNHEAVAVALVRLAASDPERSAEWLRDASSALPAGLRQWVGLQIARQAVLRQQPEALGYLREALEIREARRDWSEETHAWAARVALRGGDWALLHRLLDPLPDSLSRDATWTFWRAQAAYRSAREGERGDAQRREARLALQSMASPLHFYGQLAADELGLRLPLPPAPSPLTDTEKKAAAQHPGLTRALRLIEAGLRSEGVREWNFSLRDFDERGLLAAAHRACQAEVWDRCINTSERTQGQVDLAQRYPMPYRDQVMSHARDAGLDPADPYGLMRQESRFIMDARSSVGAGGLMQLMPATARWTAKKIGLPYKPGAVHELDFNLRVGMAYLKMVLDDFDGALPLAAAAYNAGPGRPRRWRSGNALDAAAWAETIPFNETRDYVKKVLANATVYARLLGRDDAQLRQRLGQMVGPRSANAKPVNDDLP